MTAKTRDQVILTVLVVVCLGPFLGKAFHIDDPLFVWTGQQIAHDPANPFGYSLTWYTTVQPMFDVTKNPPLASYYIAVAGALFGWSEAVLHTAFLLPALAVVLGIYSLAARFTRLPLLAAIATLVAPGFMLSSTSVMSDTMMVAFWVMAALCWLNGLDGKKPGLLAVAGLLMAFCALTKYFGIVLIPLLLLYSVMRQRRVGSWIVYLVLPVAALALYEYWTKSIYGHGLIAAAADYSVAGDTASHWKPLTQLYKAVVGLSFAGGCALPALTLAPLLWSRRYIFLGGAAAGLTSGAWGWMQLGAPASRAVLPFSMASHFTLAVFIAGGLGALALAVSDCYRNKDAESTLLLAWVLGTLIFASFVNWTANGRSVLPMIPAIGILLARRVETARGLGKGLRTMTLAAPLVLSGAISLWVNSADAAEANAGRTAAHYVRSHFAQPGVHVGFEGHWGFQYYMQALGFEPVDFWEFKVQKSGDLVVIPRNNTNSSVKTIGSNLVGSQETFAVPANTGMATMNPVSGAGYYSDLWGPLPYSFGPAPAEEYTVLRLKKP